jgi:hypothetical protein
MVIICRSLRPGRRISPPSVRCHGNGPKSVAKITVRIPGIRGQHLTVLPPLPKRNVRRTPPHADLRIRQSHLKGPSYGRVQRDTDDAEKGGSGPCRGAEQTPPPGRPQGRSGKNLSIDVDGSRRGPCGSVPIPIVRVAAILASISALHRLKYTAPPSLAMPLRDVRVRPRNAADGGPSFRQAGG